MFTLAISFSTMSYGPNIQSSNAILFFTASNFTFTTRHINNWGSFPLSPTCFIFSGAISNCPLLLPSSILDTFHPWGSTFGVIYLFVFLYHPLGSPSKNPGRFCHGEAGAPTLWPSDVKSRFIGKDLYTGKDWRQKEKRTAEDEMVGYQHYLIDMILGNSGRQWGTMRPGMLPSMGSPRVGHNLANKLQQYIVKLTTITIFTVLYTLYDKYILTTIK